jgi:hypothetical protein
MSITVGAGSCVDELLRAIKRLGTHPDKGGSSKLHKPTSEKTIPFKFGKDSARKTEPNTTKNLNPALQRTKERG